MKKLAAILIALFCMVGCGHAQNTESVPVVLAASNGLTVIGKNPIEVERGEKAVFSVKIPDGYTIESLTPDVVYNKQMGTVTLSNVEYPTTVKLSVKEQKMIRLKLKAEGEGQIAGSREGTIEAGSAVSLSAKSEDGHVFLGYTFGKSLRNGGGLLSAESEFTYIAEQTGTLYANFASPEDTIIYYDLNGGHLKNSDSTQFIQIVEQTFHLCPNALPDTGMFVRDGYVLAGYSTEPDGSGTFYAPGWNVGLADDALTTLYAVWLKETPADRFTFTKSDTYMTISGYTGGPCEQLVLPTYADGLPVKAITEGAFTDIECEEIFIPRTITKIADRAFRNCSFSVCRFSDSVTVVLDTSFDSCPNFSTLIIGAVREPTYQTTQHGTYSVKYERLMSTDSRKMVITAGSSSAYGFLSAQFINELAAAGHEGWDVVNYACHFETPGRFYIDVISHFLNEGDVLLHSPEPLPAQLGSNDMTAVMWQFFEGAYEAFSLVDIREYDKLFSSFSEFNMTRSYMPATSYEDHWVGVNNFGDVDYFKSGQFDGYIGGQGMFNFASSFIRSEELNTVYDRAAANGASVWLTFAPVNEGAVLPPSQKRSMQEDYMQFMRDNLHAVVISDVADQIWKGRYMHDTNLHLSTEAAKLRTTMIAQDFIRQLEADKQ